MRWITLIAIVVLSAASTVCAEDDAAAELVLMNGKRMEVTRTSVEGQLVYVTFATGQMQAYPIEEVDLQASGLIPEAVAEVAEEKKVRGIASARSPETGLSGATITDQDVEHVKPKPPEEDLIEDQADAAGAPVALAIKDPKSDITPTTVNYTGTVTNVGSEPVNNILLMAKAVDDKGVTIGSGSRSIPQTLAPKGEVIFAMSFPYKGTVHRVKVTAQASLANFEFTTKQADQADTGEKSN